MEFDVSLLSKPESSISGVVPISHAFRIPGGHF